MAVETVLIIDDSQTERAFLSDILIKAGYKCILAETGQPIPRTPVADPDTRGVASWRPHARAPARAP